MENKDLDLDKYYNGLLNLRRIITFDLPIAIRNKERKARLKWLFLGRILERGENEIIRRLSGICNEQIKELDNDIEKFRNIVKSSGYIDNISKIENLENFGSLVPSFEEFELIEIYRKGAFNDELRRFESRLNLSSSNRVDFIASVLNELVYHFQESYSKGVLIFVKNELDRKVSVLNFGYDLGKYDFVKYLKSELVDDVVLVDSESEDDLKLSVKILFLKKLGFFDLPMVKELKGNSYRKAGKIVNMLLDCEGNDRTRKYISGLDQISLNFNPYLHEEKVNLMLEKLMNNKD